MIQEETKKKQYIEIKGICRFGEIRIQNFTQFYSRVIENPSQKQNQNSLITPILFFVGFVGVVVLIVLIDHQELVVSVCALTEVIIAIISWTENANENPR